jgi:SAM-dependent methyltransferase
VLHELDKQKIDRFWQGRTSIQDPRIATNYRDDNRLQLDYEFVRRLLPEKASVLDLGAGSCTLAGMLLPHVSSILAIDKFPEFLSLAPKSEKLLTRCADVASFQSDDLFDVILLFGVANFLTETEEFRLYGQCKRMLKQGGVFIVKNQCGSTDEVLVDKYSEELGAHYHARYPAVDSQRGMLQSLFHVTTHDIYPPAINRWPDTHFYAFVCQHATDSYRH